LRLNPELNLVFVGPGQDIPAVDLIILPGTKNVRGDLALLKEWSWDMAILKHCRYGGKLLGICGGFQMLGEWIDDPDGIEDKAGRSEGLGLLKMSTVLEQQKILQQVKGQLLINDKSQATIVGYEIHCGRSTFDKPLAPLMAIAGQGKEGVISDDQKILGTYVHGLFDQPQAAKQLLEWAGFNVETHIDIHQHREQQLDRFADCLEQSMAKQFWALFDQGQPS